MEDYLNKLVGGNVPPEQVTQTETTEVVSDPETVPPEKVETEPVKEVGEKEILVEEEPKKVVQEAPPVTPPQPEPPKTMPVAAHVQEKRKFQGRNDALELQVRELQEKLNLIAERQTPTTPDPLEALNLKVAAGEQIEVGEMVKTIQLHDQWIQQQAIAKQVKELETIGQQAERQALQTYTEEAMGEGFGYATVITNGDHLLLPQDKEAIRLAGPNKPQLRYGLCLERLMQSGTAQGQLYAQSFMARQQQKMAPIPAPLPKASSAPTAPLPIQEKKVEAPTVQEILLGKDPVLAHAGFDDI